MNCIGNESKYSETMISFGLPTKTAGKFEKNVVSEPLPHLLLWSTVPTCETCELTNDTNPTCKHNHQTFQVQFESSQDET